MKLGYSHLITALISSMFAGNASAAGSITGIDDVGGFPGNIGKTVLGLSGDGTSGVGALRLDISNYRAYKFTATGNIELTGPLGDQRVFAQSASGDGSVVVGWSSPSATSASAKALVWDNSTTTPTVLGDLGTSILAGHAYAVSDNGTVVAGDSYSTGYHAVRWAKTGGTWGAPEDLHGGNFTMSFSRDIDATGATVVGYGSNANHVEEAFRWTQATGMVGLGVLANHAGTGSRSRANGVSADGSVVTGWSESPISAIGSAIEAFRWTSAGMTGLGFLAGGTYSKASGINADGTVIVGNANRPVVFNGVPLGFTGGAAFRWQSGVGMQSIEDWLTANGVAVGSNTFSDAVAVDASGNVVTGMGQINGYTQIYIARVAVAGTTGTTATATAPTGGSPTATTGGSQTVTSTAAPLGTIGTGVMGLQDFYITLQDISRTFSAGLNFAGMTLFGAHHRALIDNGLGNGNCMWATGDFGGRNNGSNQQRLGEVGVCGDFSDWRLGVGVGGSDIRNDLTLGGSSRFSGQHLYTEADYRFDNSLIGSVSAFYGSWNGDLRRNYLNGAAIDSSAGRTGVQSLALRMRMDWLDALKLGSFDLSPFTAYSHSTSRVDGYTEVGGGFPVQFNNMSLTNREFRLGTSAKIGMSPDTDLRLSLEGIHHADDASNINGVILGIGAFSIPGEAAPRSQARLGAEIDHRIGKTSVISASLHTTTGNRPSYLGSVSWRTLF